MVLAFHFHTIYFVLLTFMKLAVFLQLNVCNEVFLNGIVIAFTIPNFSM